MMTLPYKIGAGILIVSAIFAGGYWQGLKSGREGVLKAAVQSYQTREKINHETDNLNPRALCLALGGLPDECADLMRGLAQATKNQ